MNISKTIEFHQAQCTEAANQFNLYEDLLKKFKEKSNEKVCIEYNAFWQIVHKSCLFASINTVSKLYDQEKSSGSLRHLIISLKASKEIFTPEAFNKRHPDKACYPNLADRCVYPGDDALDIDIKSVAAGDELVRRLVIWRNNYYSHYSIEVINDPTNLNMLYKIDASDIKTLIQRADIILNKYQVILSATSWSRKCIGYEAVDHIFSHLSEFINKKFA